MKNLILLFALLIPFSAFSQCSLTKVDEDYNVIHKEYLSSCNIDFLNSESLKISINGDIQEVEITGIIYEHDIRTLNDDSGIQLAATDGSFIYMSYVSQKEFVLFDFGNGTTLAFHKRKEKDLIIMMTMMALVQKNLGNESVEDFLNTDLERF